MPFHTKAARASKRGSVTTPPGANIARPDLARLAREQGIQGLQIPGVNAPPTPPDINRQQLLLAAFQGATKAAQPQFVDIGGGFRARVQPSFTQALIGGGQAAAQTKFGQLQQEQQFRRKQELSEQEFARKEVSAGRRFGEKQRLQRERLQTQRDIAQQQTEVNLEATRLRGQVTTGTIQAQIQANAKNLADRISSTERLAIGASARRIDEIKLRQGLITERDVAKARRKIKEKIKDLGARGRAATRALKLSMEFAKANKVRGQLTILPEDHMRSIIDAILGGATDEEIKQALKTGTGKTDDSLEFDIFGD